jgi:F0F1-type ATP synthase delta subunit
MMWIKHSLVLIAMMALPATIVLAEEEGPEVDDIVAGLTEALELTEDQQKQVETALQEYMIGLHKATEESEDDEEGGESTITKVKKERETFNGKVKDILTKEQFAEYEVLVDQILTEMFDDLAGIKLLDLQPALELTDEQVEQLEPVMGKGMRSMLAVIMENADKKLRAPQKIKVGKKLKGIESEMNTGMKKIMTEEQWAKYEAMKEAQKEAAKS